MRPEALFQHQRQAAEAHLGRASCPPAIAASLMKWQHSVASKDIPGLSSLLHSDVVLKSPLGFKPLQGRESVAPILTAVSELLSNFEYQREFVSADGHSAALEFSANIGNRQLKGIDLLRFAENGKLTELEIMVRPFNALQALGAAMARRLGVSRFRTLRATCLALLRAAR